MNIFVLDKSPILSAEYHMDRHVVKMPLETAQMLFLPYYEKLRRLRQTETFSDEDLDLVFRDLPRRSSSGAPAPYRETHRNHPCSRWVLLSYHNWLWALILGKSLCKEYTYRYGRQHAVESILNWMYKNPPEDVYEETNLTPFSLAVADDCKVDDAVATYRSYYLKHKSHLAVWSHRGAPDWWTERT